MLLHNLWIELGNSRNTLFWKDKWVDSHTSLESWCPNNVPLPVSYSTVNEWILEDGNWDIEKIKRLISDQDTMLKILAIPPPLPSNPNDRLAWAGTKEYVFSVKSAYSIVHGEASVQGEDVWRCMWSWKGPFRFQIHVWKVLHGRLLMNARKGSWSGNSTDCPWCVGVLETMLHALRDCKFASQVWFILCHPK